MSPMNRLARAPRWMIGLALAAAVAALAAVVWLAGARETGGDDQGARADREHPIVTAARIVEQDGRSVIRLDAEALNRAGIRTEPVTRGAQPESIRAFATIVDVAPLARSAAALVAARAQAQGARARLAATQAEYERSKRLFEQDQNVSAGQLQSAQAAYLADQASLSAVQAQADAELADARLQWGAALGDALLHAGEHAGALLDDLAARRQALIQVVLPGDAQAGRPPAQGRVLLEQGEGPALRYLSPAPRADPRLAGQGHFYLAPAHPALVPGASVRVQLPTGRSVDAARIPPSALVWWQGRAWVFIRNRGGDFERREIALDVAGERAGPGLVADLGSGTEVVVQGAQVLLSEELRAENFSTDVGGR